MATYLVTQATGQQSQWVIRHLLESENVKVHALVRNLATVPTVLQQPGVTLFEGESTQHEAVARAATGCLGAFLNTVAFVPGLERRQAETLVAACRQAGVAHVVAATTFYAHDSARWDNEATRTAQLHDYFASKAAVEAAVRQYGAGSETARFSYTILRPAVLHHDFFLPGTWHNFPRLPTHGEIDALLLPGATLPYTDTHDVGRYAAAALLDPATFAGREVDLAHEALTFAQVDAILGRTVGGDIGAVVRVVQRTEAELEALGASVAGQRFQIWANGQDFRDVAASARDVQMEFGIPFTSLEAALQRDRACLLKCLLSNKQH